MTSVAVADAEARPAARVRTKTTFYVALSIFMVGIVLAGFWPSYLWLSPLLIGMLYDWRTRGRPHAVYVISALWLFVGATRVLVTESAAWQPIGRAILAAFV